MFYHGTTLENARHLLAGGEKESYIWNCSFDDYLYVWSGAAIKESEDLEDEEIEEYSIRLAFESAAITAACSKEPQKELIVLEFDFPEADVYEDFSCNNMDCARRVSSLNSLYFERNLIKVYSAKHNSRLDPFVLVGLLGKNDFFDPRDLDPDLKEAIELLDGSEIYYEELFNYEWKEIDKKVLTIAEIEVG